MHPREYSKTYLKEFPGRKVKITYDQVPLGTWYLINVHFSRALGSGTKVMTHQVEIQVVSWHRILGINLCPGSPQKELLSVLTSKNSDISFHYLHVAWKDYLTVPGRNHLLGLQEPATYETHLANCLTIKPPPERVGSPP